MNPLKMSQEFKDKLNSNEYIKIIPNPSQNSQNADAPYY